MPHTDEIGTDTKPNQIANGGLSPIAIIGDWSDDDPQDGAEMGGSATTEYLNGLYGSLADLRDELRDNDWDEESILAEISNREAAFDFTGEALICLGESGPYLIKPNPTVCLPGGEQPISATAAELAKELANAESHFNRGGVVVRLVKDEVGRPSLSNVSAAALTSDIEEVAVLIEKDRKGVARPATCSEARAKLILASRAFAEELPRLRVISNCPLLIERDDELLVVTGYDRKSGILAQGAAPAEMDLPEAIGLLDEILVDFQFATPSDRSRALAAIITPALNMGELLPGRAALDLGEANDSQSGKGFRQRLTAAVYGQLLAVVTVQKSGVGGLDEAFDRQLIAGKNFILLDNIRGKIDRPKIESFLTEDTYNARCSYSRNMEINPRLTCVMFTSNKADITKDLANRSACVRILKQPDGYQYRKYPEGDILDRVRAQQSSYLGAVFTVVREWHAAGKPRTTDTRHDFRGWAQTLDWIVQNVLGAPPLLDGHRETQQRMTTPALNWLREVALAVMRQGKAGQWLIASDILECADEDGDIAIPGLREWASLEDADVRRQVLSQIGKMLGRCFKESNEIAIDGMGIAREQYKDEQYRDRYKYMVYKLGDEPVDLYF